MMAAVFVLGGQTVNFEPAFVPDISRKEAQEEQNGTRPKEQCLPPLLPDAARLSSALSITECTFSQVGWAFEPERWMHEPQHNPRSFLMETFDAIHQQEQTGQSVPHFYQHDSHPALSNNALCSPEGMQHENYGNHPQMLNMNLDRFMSQATNSSPRNEPMKPFMDSRINAHTTPTNYSSRVHHDYTEQIRSMSTKVESLSQQLNAVTEERDNLRIQLRQLQNLCQEQTTVVNGIKSKFGTLEKLSSSIHSLCQDTWSSDQLSPEESSNDNSFASNPMTRLSAEMLAHIFRFISRRDLLTLAQSCRTWRDIVYNSPNLWRKLSYQDICLKFRSDNGLLISVLSRYYFQWLHEIDLGFRAQKAHLLEDAQHIHSKELQQLSKAIFDNCKTLRSLTICAARLYDATLKSICDNCKSLEVLCVESSKKTLYTDEGLSELAQLSQLHSLCLPSSEHYSDRGVSRLIKRLGSQLISLEFHFINGVNNRFTDNAVQFISKYCLKLSNISLQGHETLTSKSLEYLSSCTQIEKVNFSLSPLILSEASVARFAAATRLRIVDVSNCQMGDAVLIALADNSHESIERIHLTSNPITDAGIKRLCEKSPKLKYMNVRSCMMLTNATVGHVRRFCPDIQTVDAKGTQISEAAWDTLSCVEL
ncbi:f-box/LRR-repeat protein 20-like isoform 2 [Planoprotostelium fungivorum]|uniref:F-box/LRR-repeat protein 20-like isoform 2 n=1 Tax=Planoprotostelium fungivorum TaxID=1890364 RepID=A0A2P6N0D0_9EUKA|nr:f-box/LRR-repeat protein 20-like isoform 2 [Planoprotostelium fungivorum]